jgi:hypothetical protein
MDQRPPRAFGSGTRSSGLRPPLGEGEGEEALLAGSVKGGFLGGGRFLARVASAMAPLRTTRGPARPLAMASRLGCGRPLLERRASPQRLGRPEHACPGRGGPTTAALPAAAWQQRAAPKPATRLGDLLRATPPTRRRRRGLGTATWRRSYRSPARVERPRPPARAASAAPDASARCACRPARPRSAARRPDHGLPTPLPRPTDKARPVLACGGGGSLESSRTPGGGGLGAGG